MTASLKVGVLGAGGVSRFHLAGYKEAGAQVVAIADAHPATLEATQTAWHVPRGYTDFEALCADPEVQAVSVCLPNALHHPATLAAARAGKHVLCEKPISLSLAQADEMIDACHEAGVILQIGHHLRSNPYAAHAKRLIDSGELGRITFIRLRQAHDWGGQEPRASFRTLASAGGGTLLDNGSHVMDLARYFGGNVRDVFARVATLAYDVEVEDTSVVSLQFESGAIGSVENAWTATGWEEAFWVYGTKGALEYTNRSGTPVMHHSFRASPGTAWDRPDVTTYHFAGLEPHSRNVADFLAAIRGERSVICTGEDGREAVRLILASYESAREQRPVTVSNVSSSARS
ncbi:Gfo/Idh/MocA family protein [Deinococcus yavapaiensis]|uniref:Putative dehydrogenase n=1 Tax=Deinococcus yavapaiensis KR-236 TaxID=694435 RepID=A0A318S2C6_9DEIO|nr:Gfo/Idh/MocA family oxidoreductase [Deinococcus yavapaiensis]PYE49441.1 putative dehydrogenase [Deinococcus yavapaiensis KR-236]